MRIAQPNETNAMYEKNYTMLTQWLQQSIEKIDEADLWNRIEVSYNDEGYPVCLYHQDGKRFHITGSKPEKEAGRWWSAIPDTIGSGAIFLYGSGFGYPIFEIFAQKKSHTLVAVFEENLYLFKAMLYFFDFQPIIQSGKIVFLVGDPEYYAPALERMLFGVFFISCTYPVVAHTYAAQRNFKEQYKRIHEDLITNLKLLVLYMGNDHKDNLIGFTNIMSNAKPILENPNISCLKNKYRGFPAFIISNGPSLDKNIRMLENVQNRGLLICVESASTPMMKNKIKPDILAVIERIKSSYTFHFKDTIYPDDISLLALAVADPRIFASFPGEMIPCFRDKEIINMWVNDHLGDGSAIDAGANVSHLAAELALTMGADPIIFVGQDFAYGPNHDTHSKDSVYAEEKGQKTRALLQSRPSFPTEGNDGTPVYSNELWLDLKKGLEIKIASYPNRTFINATEGGAKIAGTKCETLENAIQKYCLHPLPQRVNELVAKARAEISFSERRIGLEKLICSIKQYSEAFRNTALELTKAKLDCSSILRDLYSDDNSIVNQSIEEAYIKNISIFNQLFANGLYRCFLQQVVFANYYLINTLKMIQTREEIIKVFEIHDRFFCQICIVCQSVSVSFEKALDPLTDELERVKRIESGEIHDRS